MHEQQVGAGFSFGRFRVDAAQRLLWIDGEAAKLGARAFDVLLALVSRRERIVSKNELLEAVWPNLVVAENNLQVQIWALRKLLGPDVTRPSPGAATSSPRPSKAIGRRRRHRLPKARPRQPNRCR